MIVFFPGGLVLMWLYAPWRFRTKWIWSGVFAVLFGLFLIASITGGGGKKSTQASAIAPSAKTPATAKPSPTPKPPPTPKAPPWSAASSITEDTVRAALNGADTLNRSVGLNKAKTVVVIPADPDPTDLAAVGCPCIQLVYKSTSALNDTDFLTIGAQTAFSAMRLLFANSLVGEVSVTLNADVTDALGNTSEEPIARSVLERATTANVNWGGLATLVQGDNKHMFCVSDEYFIAPFIYAKLGDTGCLTGSSRSRPLPGG